MKKILSLLLVVALCFSLALTAIAATPEARDAADKLNKLGLFNGVGDNTDGTPNYDLDRAPNRMEAVTLLVRLLGKEAEAKAGKWTMPFTDVADWAKPYVGYAYENGLTSGTSATTFSGTGIVSATQYLTFVLRALEYSSDSDFAWNSAWELTDALGITNGEYGAASAFTRGDAVIVSAGALDVTLKDGSKTLLESIEENLANAPQPKPEPTLDANSARLVGVWLEIDIDNIYTFNADGTGNEYFDGDDWDMTWELKGSTLMLDFGKAGIEVYEVEFTATMFIVHAKTVDFEYVRYSDSSAGLVGVWVEIDIDNIYTFNADGTGNEYFDGNDWDMTWELNGTTLTMDFPETGVEVYEIEFTDMLLIVHAKTIDFEYVRQP